MRAGARAGQPAPYTAHVRIQDVTTDPGVLATLDMLRAMTGASNGADAFREFMTRFGRVRPVHYFLGVIPDAETGAYRVSYRVPIERLDLLGTLPTRDAEISNYQHLPLCRGGFVAEVIASGRPVLVSELELRGDPLLGDELAEMRTCMVLPIFEGQRIIEWALTFSRLADTFGALDFRQALMTSNLVSMANNHLNLLDEVRRLNARLKQQFEDVAQLQRALLPERTPDIPGLRIATSYLTSDEAGGDYYDFIRLPDGCWVIVIADVSGHGAAAATVTAMLHAILHCFAPEQGEFSPENVLRYANAKLMAAGLEGNFVTAFVGLYDPARGTVRYASAGHNPPRCRRGMGGRVEPLEDASGLPLGVLDEFEIASATLTLAPGDTLLLYTDGITEAMDTRREMFGSRGLDQALARSGQEPDDVVESIHRALFAHRTTRTRDDDQTLVVVRFLGVVAPGEASR